MPEWENYERLSIEGKWRPCLRTAGRVIERSRRWKKWLRPLSRGCQLA
jgi:hypothetical protein